MPRKVEEEHHKAYEALPHSLPKTIRLTSRPKDGPKFSTSLEGVSSGGLAVERPSGIVPTEDLAVSFPSTSRDGDVELEGIPEAVGVEGDVLSGVQEGPIGPTAVGQGERGVRRSASCPSRRRMTRIVL